MPVLCLCQAEIKRGKGWKPEKSGLAARPEALGKVLERCRSDWGFQSQAVWVQTPTSLLTRCVIWGKWLSFSVPVSLCVNGDNGTYVGPGQHALSALHLSPALPARCPPLQAACAGLLRTSGFQQGSANERRWREVDGRGGVEARVLLFLPGVRSLQATPCSCCKGPPCFQLPDEPRSHDSHALCLPSSGWGWGSDFL